MFQVLGEEKIISVIMFTSLVLSMGCRIMIGILYQNMIKETDNMSATGNKLLKQCKLKFANCYQLNKGVANIPVFVDKFINKLSIGPLPFQTAYHMSGQLMLLSVLFAGIGVCKSIIVGRSIGELLPFYIISFLGLYLYFSVSAITDIKGKRRILKVNLVDYLENHMVNKLNETEIDLDRLGLSGEGIKREGRRTVDIMPIGAPKDTVQPAQFTKSDEKELEELLKEFLTS